MKMESKQLNEQVITILSADSRLVEMWLQSPDAALIPYMGSRDSFFLLVSLCLLPAVSRSESISYATISTLRKIYESGLAKDLPGIEVVVYIGDNSSKTGFRRILRFTVKNCAFDKIPELGSENLNQANPRDGLTCTWYENLS
jgi:hypothetical protein